MRTLLGAVALCAALAVLVPGSGHSLRATQYPSRPLDGLEVYERLVDQSELLLIARVTRVDSTTTELVPSLGVRARLSTLEPVEWLRGGLDGDEIEVVTREDPVPEPGVTSSFFVLHPTWARIARVDSMGALVRLQRTPKGWFVARWGGDGMDSGFRILPQRSFKAVRDSIVEARERMSVDGLVSRADVIVVTGDSLDIPYQQRRDPGLVAVARVLKGARVGSTVAVQPWLRYRCASGDVLFLVGRGPYEPIPFHRERPPTFDVQAAGGMTPIEIESAVRTSLARAETRKSWR